MATTLADEQVRAALTAIETEDASPSEKAEMLMEIAMGLQQQPKTPQQIHDAIGLYERALALCSEDDGMLHARLQARMGTALQAVPEEGSDSLHAARAAFESALEGLREGGLPEEIGEIQMNLGLVQQALAGFGQARITDAIAHYQMALQTFSRERNPKEFAILHNNLATAFLSIPFSDQRAKMREALAVQSFEEGLKVVDPIDHPVEYAMLQNNLGNALQYASSSHAVENNLRALEAYDEALKVRRPDSMPLEYANTIANKANCLRNLPDAPAEPALGNRGNLMLAMGLYGEAHSVFERHGETAKASVVAEALDEIEAELAALPRNGAGDTSATAQA